jgi:predicted CXXCH cytochrome family protein
VASPLRWLPRARFDHQPHTMLECQSCHPAAASQAAADVLVPGIQNCQQCHRPRGVDQGCTECHDYHDWTQAQRVKGRYKIEQLRGGRAALGRAAPPPG